LAISAHRAKLTAFESNIVNILDYDRPFSAGDGMHFLFGQACPPSRALRRGGRVGRTKGLRVSAAKNIYESTDRKEGICMKPNQPMTRRDSLKKLLQVSGAAALTAFSGWPLSGPKPAWAKDEKKKFIIEGLGQTEGYAVKALTEKVFEAAGGITRFISRGDVVVIKPKA
jgi:hypothetical protein